MLSSVLVEISSPVILSNDPAPVSTKIEPVMTRHVSLHEEEANFSWGCCKFLAADIAIEYASISNHTTRL